jgi:hypothetical protein
MYRQFLAGLVLFGIALSQVLYIIATNMDIKFLKDVSVISFGISYFSAMDLGARLRGTSFFGALFNIFNSFWSFFILILFYPMWGIIHSILWLLNIFIPFVPSYIDRPNISIKTSKKEKVSSDDEIIEESNESSTDKEDKTLKANSSRIRSTKANEKKYLTSKMLEKYSVFKVTNDGFGGAVKCDSFDEAMRISNSKFKDQIVKVWIATPNGAESREIGYYLNGEYI